MRLWIAGILTALAPALALADQDTGLKQLDTGDAARGWDAVGRLDMQGVGFCTGALIAPDLVLTAAHCMFDKKTGQRVAPDKIEFLAGWRNGRAAAYRQVRQSVVHPDYVFSAEISPERVRADVALVQLQHPIRNTSVVPFLTTDQPRKGSRIGVVSYAFDRAEAPSLQEVCKVMARQSGMLVTSCDVDKGSSGAPIFSFENGKPEIVSVVSAKAEVRGTRVSLGTELAAPLQTLRAELAAGNGLKSGPTNRVRVGAQRHSTGAKFLKP